jgi:hypothetical protein
MLKFFASNDTGEAIPDAVSWNEGDLFYNKGKLVSDDSLRVFLKYMKYRPDFDGNPQTQGSDVKYTGVGFSADNFTNLPWIKEISVSHKPPDFPKILWWQRN